MAAISLSLASQKARREFSSYPLSVALSANYTLPIGDTLPLVSWYGHRMGNSWRTWTEAHPRPWPSGCSRSRISKGVNSPGHLRKPYLIWFPLFPPMVKLSPLCGSVAEGYPIFTWCQLAAVSPDVLLSIIAKLMGWYGLRMVAKLCSRRIAEAAMACGGFRSPAARLNGWESAEIGTSPHLYLRKGTVWLCLAKGTAWRTCRVRSTRTSGELRYQSRKPGAMPRPS